MLALERLVEKWPFSAGEGGEGVVRLLRPPLATGLWQLRFFFSYSVSIYLYKVKSLATSDAIDDKSIVKTSASVECVSRTDTNPPFAFDISPFTASPGAASPQKGTRHIRNQSTPACKIWRVSARGLSRNRWRKSEQKHTVKQIHRSSL